MSIVISDGRAVRLQSTAQAPIREAVTEVTRALEDINWLNLSTDWRTLNGNDEKHEDRQRLLQRLRMYRRRNPLAKQAAGLTQHYTLGQGIGLRAENKKVVARIVDEFWNDPVNEAVLTSHEALKKFVDDLWTDGEVFLVLFADEKAGTVQMSTLDPVFVTDIINDPDNHRIPKWYKVNKPKQTFDFKSGVWETTDATKSTYYRDWRNKDQPPSGATMERGAIYHVAINKRGKRGESELFAASDWLKAHREFMEDRATINRAAAQVAWKKKRKGGATDVAAEVARLRSSLVSTLAQYETNPAPASGATIVENEGTSLEWVKTDTGGSAATADERILRMMSGSGMGGIPNHYFGDEANANLATATAMELPLLKTYEDWQQLVRGVLLNIVEYVLQVANSAGRVGDRDDSRKYADRVTTPQAVAEMPDQQPSAEAREAFAPFDGDPAQLAGGQKLVMVPKKASAENVRFGNDTSGAVSWYVDIDFPPIVQKDLTALTTALKQLFDILPSENIESQKLIIEMFLQALGVNDIDQTMERLFPADMVAVLVPSRPPMPVPPMLGAGQKPPTALPSGPSGAQPREAVSLAERRVTRLLRLASAVDSVADDVAVVAS